LDAFWIIFWISFLAVPVLYLLSQRIASSGSSASATHLWVYKNRGRRYSDATVREVWQRRHPGKDFIKAQEAVARSFFLFLLLVLLVLLGMAAPKMPGLAPEDTSLRLFQQFGSGVLGLLAGLVFFYLNIRIIDNYSETIYRTAHGIGLIVLAIVIILLIVLSLLGRPLPFSKHLLWIPVGGMIIIWGFVWLMRSLSQIVGTRGSKKLEDWSLRVINMYFRRAFTFVMEDFSKRKELPEDFFQTMLPPAVQALEEGKLDQDIQDPTFFAETESILLTLINRKRIIARERALITGQKEIFHAVQRFYFYTAKLTGKPIHPKIRAKLIRVNV
jgi:hypothetical protein